MNAPDQYPRFPEFTRSTLPLHRDLTHTPVICTEPDGSRSLLISWNGAWRTMPGLDPLTGQNSLGFGDPGGYEARNPTDLTATRALAAADFGAGLIRLNAAGVIALTLPTVAAMGLVATPGLVRKLRFLVAGGGIPTFAGATAGTSINGTAGAATVAPLGGAPVTHGIYSLVQQAVGGDAWSLFLG